MDFINLAHGVQYMLGAYLAVTFYGLTGNFFATLVLALVAAMALGLLLEIVVFRHFYDRDHPDQVLATFGVILFLNGSEERRVGKECVSKFHSRWLETR